MKKLFITYYFLIVAFSVAAQKQANIWYFGNRVGLDFNQLPPVPAFSAVNSFEGTAVISDQNGKLLFYTNGLNLLNRKHAVMKNGSSLLGDVSSTDNAVIIPSPANDSIYYLFTIGSADQLNKGLRYDIINMNADNGFGEVTDKNILMEPASFEKLGAIRHCNNKDVWVVIHKWNTDEYDAYLVSGAGVATTPIKSHTGLFISNTQNNTIGTLKFSIDGTKLAAAHAYENNVIELMDFNKATGQITNAVVFRPDPVGTPQNFTGVYGVEFSPNGNLLYVTDNSSSDDPGTLYQFDISSHNATTILASKQIIASPSPWFSGALQTGPDHKIYMALLSDTSLSVIEDPDVYGAGCNYINNKIFLGQNSSTPVQFGLPNFIQSYFDITSNPYDFTRTGNCADRNVAFSINRVTSIDSVKWDFGDGQRSQLLSPLNQYATPGTYTVNLIVYKVDCSGLNDTISHTIWVAGNADFLGADVESCGLPSVQIGVTGILNANYLWNTGSSANQITADTFGLFWLRIEQNGCTITDSINLIAKPQALIHITGDSAVCANTSITLNAGSAVGRTYLWNTGATTASISVNKAGFYRVEVTESSCMIPDSVEVFWGDCGVFIPNAFAPSGDNKVFGVASGFATYGFFMQIFDRWGNIVFAAGNPSQKWDGTYKGIAMPAGAYTWMINYVDGHGKKQFLRGSVMLIR